MKKFLFVFAVLGAIALGTFAQTATFSSTNDHGKFSIGLEAGLPVGDASEAYNFVGGFSLKYEYPIVTNAFLTLSAGYNAWFIKSELRDFGDRSASNFIPLKAGIKYYAGDGFFLEGQAGIVFCTESYVGSSFAYAPGIGHTFMDGFEAAVRYEGWLKDGVTVSQIGFRAAFRF